MVNPSAMSGRRQRVRASWFWSVENEPCPDAELEFEIGPSQRTRDAIPKVELDGYCIVPAAINSHTHFDLSFVERPIPANGRFVEWILGVVQARLEYVRSGSGDSQAFELAWLRGLQECRSYGTRAVVDMTPIGLCGFVASQDFAEHDCRLISLFELLEPTTQRAEETRNFLERAEKQAEVQKGTSKKWGLSPHAPYTVSAALLQRAMANVESALTSIHFLESQSEVEFLEKRTGELADFSVGLNDRLESIEHVLSIFAGCASPLLLAHCNYPTEMVLQWLAEHRHKVAVVYCPRTHQHFGHSPYPMDEFLSRNVRVLLGTDSLASNPDLDIRQEAVCVARNYPNLSAEKIWRMFTVDAAGVHSDSMYRSDKGVWNIDDWAAIPIPNSCTESHEIPQACLERLLQSKPLRSFILT